MILESLRFRFEGLWSLEEKDLCSCPHYDDNQILDLSLACAIGAIGRSVELLA